MALSYTLTRNFNTF